MEASNPTSSQTDRTSQPATSQPQPAPSPRFTFSEQPSPDLMAGEQVMVTRADGLVGYLKLDPLRADPWSWTITDDEGSLLELGPEYATEGAAREALERHLCVELDVPVPAAASIAQNAPTETPASASTFRAADPITRHLPNTAKMLPLSVLRAAALADLVLEHGGELLGEVRTRIDAARTLLARTARALAAAHQDPR